MKDVPKIKAKEEGNLKKIPRIDSIDFLRGIAILIMISGHFGLWFLDGDELSWGWWDRYGMYFGPIGAPIFLICVGFSLVFFVENKRQGSSEKEVRNAIFRRGGFLWGFGYILNFLMEPISRWWIWNIIVLIGVSTIITYFMLRFTIPQRIIISSIFLILNPLAQLLGSISFYLNTGILIWDPFILHNILHTYTNVHDVWNPFSLNMVLIGTIIGSFTLNKIKKGEINTLPKKFLIYGIALCIFGASIDANLRLQGVMPLILEFEHEVHIIFSTGVFLLCFSLFFWLYDIKKRNFTILRSVMLLSSLSFTIYVTHSIVAKYFFGNIFGNILGNYGLFEFLTNPFIKSLVYMILRPGNLITTYSLQIITYIFILSFYNLAVFWNRYRLKYSLEWIIRKLS